MSKDKFLAAFQTKTQKYKFRNGYEITLRGLSVGEREKLMGFADKPSQAQAFMVTAVCDDISDNDIDAVMALPGDQVSEITDIIMALSGLSPGADDDAKKN